VCSKSNQTRIVDEGDSTHTSNLGSQVKLLVLLSLASPSVIVATFFSCCRAAAVAATDEGES